MEATLQNALQSHVRRRIPCQRKIKRSVAVLGEAFAFERWETVKTVWNFGGPGAYPALKCGVNGKISRRMNPP